jgi:hypothetical protein
VAWPGDVIGFLTKHDKLSFGGALQSLGSLVNG